MNRRICKNPNSKKNIHFLLMIICLSLFFIKTEEDQIFQNSFSSVINLVIKRNDTSNLLNDTFYIKPSEVYINGIYSNNNTFDDINNVTLIFNDSIESCEYMFYGLNHLLEIDLSNFDFSNIKSLAYMFGNCSNLEKINFGNIKASSVVNMSGLFYNCTTLSSIDLSNFDTSLVTNMEEMFYNCTNLTSINLSSFNTANVQSLKSFLFNCSKLTSIDMSNFDTFSVTSMEEMFGDAQIYHLLMY